METLAIDRNYLERLLQLDLLADAGTTQFCYNYVDALDFLDSLNPQTHALDSLVCWKNVMGQLKKELSCSLELTLEWENAETIRLAREAVTFLSVGIVDIYQFGIVERRPANASRRSRISYSTY